LSENCLLRIQAYSWPCSKLGDTCYNVRTLDQSSASLDDTCVGPKLSSPLKWKRSVVQLMVTTPFRAAPIKIVSFLA
jgi:hypothetical protein